MWNLDNLDTCKQCILFTTRKNVVAGEGNLYADIMFIGEAPGYYEDKQGRPFVGDSGKLLDECLLDLGVVRNQVYITNIVKCRPPGNRVPYPKEIQSCINYLVKEIELVQPKIIVTLGMTAFSAITGKNGRISDYEGQVFRLNSRILVPLFHPSYILRNPSKLAHFKTSLSKIIALCE